MLQRHGLIQLTSLKTRFSYQLIGLQRCGNDGVVQPTTTMEMGVQVLDMRLLRAYAELSTTGGDSRRPTNRTPLDPHEGRSPCSARGLYPGRCRPQGLPLHVLPCILAASDQGAPSACCSVSRPPPTTGAPAARVALCPRLLLRTNGDGEDAPRACSTTAEKGNSRGTRRYPFCSFLCLLWAADGPKRRFFSLRVNASAIGWLTNGVYAHHVPLQ